MSSDHPNGDSKQALPGESNITIVHGPLTEEQQRIQNERQRAQAEKEADAADKKRQFQLTESNVKLTATNVKVTWVLAVFTAIGAGAAAYQAYIGNKNARASRDSADAAISSAYMSCLNAQATQITFLQLQRSASDSHSSAVATVEQTTAAIRAERAIISFIPRFPNRGELLNNELAIPYVVRNKGKSEALALDLRFKAVLLSEKDILLITDKNFERIQGKYVPGGAEFPDKPEDPKYKAMTTAVPVRDTKEELIPASSQEAVEFLGGGPELLAAVYGHMEYSDFSGFHKIRFCNTVFVMKNGTTRKTTKNEIICAKYNHQDDQYTSVPKIDTLPPIDTTQIKPINCVKPTG